MNRIAFTPAMWLLATAVATLLPHMAHLPLWVSAVCGLLLAWRATLLSRHAGTPPNRLLVLFVGIAVGFGIKFHFGHFFGKDPGTALLAMLLCLKIVEARGARDVRAAVLLSLFLQLGLFLYDQTPAVAAMALAGTLLAIVTLLSLHDERASAGAQLRAGALLLGHGLPFMLVFFVLFPRVQGPLWGLPADAHSGVSGLSDSMSPGSISRLGLSEAIAFRAEFHGRPPPPSERYWRGPVLTTFDGRVWRPAPFEVSRRPGYAAAGPAYDYRLTVEPHGRDWILALDFPAANLPRVRYASDFQLLADVSLRTRTRFELRAYPAARVGVDESPQTLAAARRLPDGSNPRSVALARKLAAGATSATAIVQRILDRFRAGALIYTLTPPPVGHDAIDAFLFDTRRGFCEHFSASFVFLVRAAGVPARVVTGYQGGEINPVDGSLIVRQSDAHAWAEVWLEGRGWVRVDPTAAAAPLRIEEGLTAALPYGEPLPFMLRPGLFWLRDLRAGWDALSNTWNQSVLGYNPDRQRELLTRFGVARPNWRSMALLLGAASAIVALTLAAWAVAQRTKRDRLDQAWRAFCRKLARRGVSRTPSEGPLDFSRRAGRVFPAQAAVLHDIAATYARLRDGPPAEPAAVRALARRIRRLILR